jgi:hypothetical protein
VPPTVRVTFTDLFFLPHHELAVNTLTPLTRDQMLIGPLLVQKHPLYPKSWIPMPVDRPVAAIIVSLVPARRA